MHTPARQHVATIVGQLDHGTGVVVAESQTYHSVVAAHICAQVDEVRSRLHRSGEPEFAVFVVACGRASGSACRVQVKRMLRGTVAVRDTAQLIEGGWRLAHSPRNSSSVGTHRFRKLTPTPFLPFFPSRVFVRNPLSRHLLYQGKSHGLPRH